LPSAPRILRKHALLIGFDWYEALADLPLATRADDLGALAAALGDPAIGGFETVELLRNPTRRLLMPTLQRKLGRCHRGNLVLVYVAGLGLLDAAGQPWLAMDAAGLLRPEERLPLTMLRTALDMSDATSQLLVIDGVWGGPEGRWPCGSPVGADGILCARRRALWLSSSTTTFTYRGGAAGVVRIDACAQRPVPFTAALADALASGAAAEGRRRVRLAALADEMAIRLGRRERDGAICRPDVGPLWLGRPGLGRLEVAVNPRARGPSRPCRSTKGGARGAARGERGASGTSPVSRAWTRWRRQGLLLLLPMIMSTLSTTVMLAANDWSVAQTEARLSAAIAGVAVDLVRRFHRAVGAQVFIDRLRDGTPGPEMRRLDGGWFVMGSAASEAERFPSEGPLHTVDVAPFALSRGEISFEQYDRFAAVTGRPLPPDAGWGRGGRPVINVSWQDAAAYAAWLGEQTGRVCRLPTEAEWEFAARAGRSTPFSTGQCITTDDANYNGREDYDLCGARTGIGRGQTLPMHALPPNRWGFYHMHGNVAEWVADCWHEDYRGAPDDSRAWERKGGDCGRRVIRGGSWCYEPGYARSAARLWARPEERSTAIGFRVACDL